MDDNYLTKDDWDTIVEMGIGPGYSEEALLKQIPGPTKAAFTRA